MRGLFGAADIFIWLQNDWRLKRSPIAIGQTEAVIRTRPVGSITNSSTVSSLEIEALTGSIRTYSICPTIRPSGYVNTAVGGSSPKLCRKQKA